MAAIPIVDIQAKDRLTGAVILVALVVLLVPELLSGPGPKHVATAVTAAGGPPLRSYTVELGDEARAHRAAGEAPMTATPPAVAAAPSTPQPIEAPPHEVPALAQAAPPVSAPVPDAVTPASRAKPNAAPEPAPGGGWMIQLGSFASRANAERLVRELKTKGYAAFLTDSTSAGRTLYRVRVGPPSDHATAQTLAAKLRAAGHPGSLTPHP